MTKEQLVQDFLNKGATAKEAAALSKSSLGYVYEIIGRINRAKGIPAVRGRKPHKKIKPVQVPVVKQPEEGLFKDVTDLKAEIIRDLKSEINDLTAVIAYLEHRLKAYGAAI